VSKAGEVVKKVGELYFVITLFFHVAWFVRKPIDSRFHDEYDVWCQCWNEKCVNVV